MSGLLPGMGFRGRLFLVSVALIAFVGAVGAAWVQRSLETLVSERIEGELGRQAHLVKVALEQVDPESTVRSVDPLVDALGAGTDARITVIALDGRVTGDSRLDPAELEAIDNHAGRPEVLRAHDAVEPVLERRYSDTLDREMLYVAVPYRAAHSEGVVRTAMDLAALDRLIRTFRIYLAVAALLGLAFAVFMTGLASHLASRDVRAVLDRIRQSLARAQDPAESTEESPRSAAGDELAGLAGGVQDLADRLQGAVGELGAERARFRALLESMSEAVLALDDTTRITLANPAATSLLRLSQPPVGRLLLEVVRSPALSDVVRIALDVDSPDDQDASDELELPGGQYVMATARPLPGHKGCVLVLHDITSARRIEQVRRDFVANVSHELRTPVAIIRANAESLADGALEEPVVARSFLDAILRNAERLSALIGDLLDLSRIESGRMSLHPEHLPVAEVAARAIGEIAPRAEAARQRIELLIPPDLEAWADARALEHILLNLLENAVKYTGEGGHIQVVAEASGDAVRIAVDDDGPGIPERHRTRVFERFYRVDPGRARAQGGTGLGLAIVKHLAESMGGAAGLEPRTPRGCSFWLRLPRVEPVAARRAAG